MWSRHVQLPFQGERPCTPPGIRWKALSLIAVAELLGMAPWFSTSAIVPILSTEWQLGESNVIWLTLVVQIGFVVGTFLSALVNLPDIVNARHLMALSAIGAAATNAAFAGFSRGLMSALAFRFLTGFFLAGVYPPGMKVMATWFRRGRGMAIGILVGALTVGKATPYLVNALGIESWRVSTLIISGMAVVGAVIISLFVSNGPYALPSARFNLGQIGKVFRYRGLRLANFGYFGHMWELYAMWTWAPVMIRVSLASTGQPPYLTDLASFLVLGAGAVGCIWAGVLADRLGRTLVTSWAMAISGACCLVIGFLLESHPFLLLTVAAIWGVAVVADSAQFSTCATELGDPKYIGTALTVQTCLGFLLTTLSIRLIPLLVDQVGWRYAFVSLAIGPFLGILSMLRLRSLPEANKIAQGRR